MITKIVEVLQNAGLVDESNEQIVIFGLQHVFNTLLDFSFAMVCSLIMGNIFVGIIFEISYSVLRVFAGGYHAPNEKICICLTYISTFVCIGLAFYLPMKQNIYSLCLLVSGLAILFLAPAESENKPLSSKEKKIYHNFCMSIFFIEVILYYFLIYLNMELYAKTVFVAIILVVFGIFAKKLERN